ncbi:MAG: aminotransferase class IV [Actinobacteria bacterium]|nr:aminotransferase class IV [Actinomycetota bacterium]
MLAYVNGDFLADGDAKVSVRDRGFMLGDGVFEVWRTYGGTTSADMIEKNLARLTKSLRYMELDPGPIIGEVRTATHEVVERNRPEIEAIGDDVLVFVIVTRGTVDELAGGEATPTITVFLNPIPARAVYGDDLYGNGARLTTSLMYRDPWGAMDPRVKSISRFAYARAERKMARAGSRTWTLFCDNDGNPTEVSGANLLLINGMTVCRPPRHTVLGGINMTTFLELAKGLGAEIEERPLTMYDYLNADEVVLTTTSVCAVRVTEIDEIRLESRGELYDRVIGEWIKYVDFDFVARAKERAGLVSA